MSSKRSEVRLAETAAERSPDPEGADGGSMAFEFEKELSVDRNTRDLLVQVGQALLAVEEGTYGTCQGVRGTDPGSASGGASAHGDVHEVRVGTTLSARRLRAIAIAAVVVVSDQLTKQWASGALDDGPINLIPGLLQLRLTENPGSAFSLFQNSGPFLGVAAIAASVLIVVTVQQSSRRDELAGMGPDPRWGTRQSCGPTRQGRLLARRCRRRFHRLHEVADLQRR